MTPEKMEVHQYVGQNPLWGAFPLSKGTSSPRDRTQVSHIAGGFFTSRATREALKVMFI